MLCFNFVGMRIHLVFLGGWGIVFATLIPGPLHFRQEIGTLKFLSGGNGTI